ncbi:hypothetical protein B9Z65_159 [Elsinoe australis]|uniref:DUS-like FMN-binding domain-containing protein n=1 Tax=Elsinoe australis TaxID=40998 RepID=A0A2P7Z7J8_9PEZI|nr:hypothetical protein B9Z65_159 [Elsinoe australis]
MSKPELVRDIVLAAKAIYGHNKSVSIKIRIHKDIDETIRFLNIVRPSGVDFVTVHARTKSQRSSTPPNLVALKTLKATFPDLPMIANGDVYSLKDAQEIVEQTGVEGAMSARGILENPCLFAGYATTPIEAVGKFMAHVARSGLRFELVLYHINEMLLKTFSKEQRKSLMECKDMIDLTDWLEPKVDIRREYKPV